MVCCTALLAACGASEETPSSESPGTGGTSGTGGGAGTPIDYPDADQPATGCGSLTEAEARSIVTTNVGAVLRGSLDAVRFAEGSKALARALSLGSGSQMEFVEDAEEGIDSLLDQLSDRVLSAGNFEAAEGSTVTFKMQPDVMCPPTEEELQNDPEGAAEEEASCRDSLAQHETRVRVTRIACDAGDSVELSLAVSPEPLVPLVLELHPKSLSLSVDVKDTTLAMQRGGSFAKDATFDSDLGGVFGLHLELGEAGVADFALDVVKDVVFGGTVDEDGRLRLWAEAARLLNMSAAPATQELTGSINAKASGFELQLADFIQAFLDREPTAAVVPSDNVTFWAPGLNGNFGFERATDTFTMTGLGLAGGPISVSYGEVTLLKIDWNAAAQRALDFVLTPSGDDVSLTLGESGLDLQLDYSMSVISDKVTEIPEFTKDDTLHVKFGPNAPAAILFENPSADVNDLLITDTQEGALLHVESGSLELTSRAVPEENVTVPAGQCLLRDSQVTGQHAFLGSLSSGACP